MRLSFHERLQLHRPLMMGILNVTPDSFSDGGVHLEPQRAYESGLSMISEGADIIDIGGESTRPGSRPVPPDEQCRRILPVIDALLRDEAGRSLPYVSVDTSSSCVAEAALARGAVLVNDVSAGRLDPRMFEVVARHQAHIVLMHMQGTPLTMQDAPTYENVVEEVISSLLERVESAVGEGIPRDHIILDPGIGFGKTRHHNLQLLAHLDQLASLPYPVLLGCSRKRFMGSLCEETNPLALVGATVATTTLGVMQGARLFRVHDVRPNRQAADVAWHIRGLAA